MAKRKLRPVVVPDEQWTSDFRDYYLLHRRLRAEHPRTGTCTLCGEIVGTERPHGTQWAKRVDVPYSQDIKDYIEACPLCHRAMDGSPSLSEEHRAKISASRLANWARWREEHGREGTPCTS